MVDWVVQEVAIQEEKIKILSENKLQKHTAYTGPGFCSSTWALLGA